MGNTHSSATPGKVILSNGAVFTYGHPLTAAELMLDHPGEVVVEFQKRTPLPADQNLETKNLYLMLPKMKGEPLPTTPSSKEARRLLDSVIKSKALLSYTGFLPLFVRICPGKNDTVLKVNEKRKGLAQGDVMKADYFGEVRSEILCRQISGKGWRPSLDTIVEKGVNQKVRHWLL